MKDRSPAPAQRPPWRRLLKPVLVIAALVVVFGWLLPQFIDYEEVWDALTQLDGWEVAVLLRAGDGARAHRGADVPGVPAGPRVMAR